jgi:hypothetical protein
VVVGLTLNGEPLPTNVPPQEPVYHFQVAFVPNEPPLTLKFVEPPGQKLLLLAEADAGAVDGTQHAVTEIVCEIEAVLLFASVTVRVTVLLPYVE